jgi:predicted DNA-binding transcriptional regulator AlpA
MSEISIREYEQRLQRLASAPPSRESLDQAVAVGKGLLSALRSWGTPPVKPIPLKLQAQSLKPIIDDQPHARAAHLVRPAEPVRRMPGTWHNARLEKRAAGSPLPPPPSVEQVFASPEGYVSKKEMLELLERTDFWLNSALAVGRFPRADLKRGTRNYWLRDKVLRWKEANPAAAPEGYIRKADMLRMLKRSSSWLARAVKGGGFPPAMLSIRSEKYWLLSAVEEWKAAHPLKPGHGAGKQYVMPEMHGPGPQPEGTYTIAQITRLCGRTQPWVYQQMALQLPGYRPFPKPQAQRWGRICLWDKAAVDAWVDWRNNQAPQRAGMRPLRSI